MSVQAIAKTISAMRKDLNKEAETFIMPNGNEMVVGVLSCSDGEMELGFCLRSATTKEEYENAVCDYDADDRDVYSIVESFTNCAEDWVKRRNRI